MADHSPVNQTVIIYPVLIQVLLTISVLVLLGPARRRSMCAKRQWLGDPEVALGSNEWSEEAAKKLWLRAVRRLAVHLGVMARANRVRVAP